MKPGKVFDFLAAGPEVEPPSIRIVPTALGQEAKMHPELSRENE
jgi:hypothetical protein